MQNRPDDPRTVWQLEEGEVFVAHKSELREIIAATYKKWGVTYETEAELNDAVSGEVAMARALSEEDTLILRVELEDLAHNVPKWALTPLATAPRIFQPLEVLEWDDQALDVDIRVTAAEILEHAPPGPCCWDLVPLA